MSAVPSQSPVRWGLTGRRVVAAPAVRVPRGRVLPAFKSPELLAVCAGRLEAGEVVALVPTTATAAYVDRVEDLLGRYAASRPADETREGILALPTSGSTGSPKLVALPASGIAAFLRWAETAFGLDAATTSLSLSPWNFDVALLDTWAVLAAGGEVLAAEASRMRDPSYLAVLLRGQRPTFVQVVPATLEVLLAAVADDGLPSVRDVVLTGGVVTRARRAAAADAFPNARFHHVYGATEVNDCLLATLSGSELAAMDDLPLGVPIEGCEVHLAGREDGVGEILVRSPWMARGYLHEGGLEPLPTVEIAGRGAFYPMRDRATLTDGQLTYAGRVDRTVKVRGQRISLDEVEQVARATDLVGMACAWLGGPGNAEEVHLAYTAPEVGQPPVPGLRLRVAMSSGLPSYAMPNQLHPFAEPFPLNGNGKPDLLTIKQSTETS